jgi:hypothetical protein
MPFGVIPVKTGIQYFQLAIFSWEELIWGKMLLVGSMVVSFE